MKKNVRNIFLVAAVYLLLPRPAFCYLDPGTGSYIFQIVIAAALGALFSVKIFYSKIKSFISELIKKVLKVI